MDKEQARRVLICSAEKYEMNIAGKSLLLVLSKDYLVTPYSVFKYIIIESSDRNFLHLTGVNTKLSAKQFYNKCLNGNLNINDFTLSRKSEDLMKLDVLEKACGLYKVK